jgi:hypothetical protein
MPGKKREPRAETTIDRLNEVIQEFDFVLDDEVENMIGEFCGLAGQASLAHNEYAFGKQERQHAIALLATSRECHTKMQRLIEIVSPLAKQLETAITAAEQEVSAPAPAPN